MGLTDPLSESDPEAWAVRFLAHVAFGLLAWHALIWIVPPIVAVAWVVAAYLAIWEGVVQRFGAGLWDAALDTMAVALGALVGLELLLGPHLWGFVGLLLAGCAVVFNGVWRRRDDA